MSEMLNNVVPLENHHVSGKTNVKPDSPTSDGRKTQYVLVTVDTKALPQW